MVVDIYIHTYLPTRTYIKSNAYAFGVSVKVKGRRMCNILVVKALASRNYIKQIRESSKRNSVI